MKTWSVVILVIILVAGAAFALNRRSPDTTIRPPAVRYSQADLRTAIFAGGCFWCMEPPFEKLAGVVSAESGYTGGHKENPTYEEVSHSDTGHVEAVRVTYDSTRIRYEDLLEVFWRSIDPTDEGGQFVDRGDSYKSAIFVSDEAQRQASEESKQKLEESGRFDQPIVTPIRDTAEFYLAEDYHQDYYKKNPLKYKYYRYRSGRDQFIDEAWGDARHYKPQPIPSSESTFTRPDPEQIRARLTPLQFKVTQKEGTEPAFENEYWNNKRAGIYVDIVSGEPLFSSKDKYRSGTGWPSFTRPLVTDNIVEKEDFHLVWPRTEVRSKHGDSHLGHVFDDGPAPTGLRYCINSAALRFVPSEDLESEGYGEFTALFEGEE